MFTDLFRYKSGGTVPLHTACIGTSLLLFHGIMFRGITGLPEASPGAPPRQGPLGYLGSTDTILLNGGPKNKGLSSIAQGFSLWGHYGPWLHMDPWNKNLSLDVQIHSVRRCQAAPLSYPKNHLHQLAFFTDLSRYLKWR